MPTDGMVVLDDRYALEEVIGRGGMADVYRATDRVLSRPVAVKLLRDVTADESDRARFTAEARTLARLSHSGLVTVLDAGTASEQPFLVMELIDGPSLATYCSGTGLGTSRVARIGIQVSDALAYAHAAGVVHRDVKPGNVLLASDGSVRLADFGIARLVGDAVRHTRTGLTIGSPAYLSPEQVRGAEVTPASDVYSLGLVLLETLIGHPVYAGTPTESALARLSTPPSIPDNLPPTWQHLLASMTALEPDQRPTATQVARTLLELGDETGKTAPNNAKDTGFTQVLPLHPSAPEPLLGGAKRMLRQAWDAVSWRNVRDLLRSDLPRRGLLRGAGRRAWWVIAGALALLLLVLLLAALAGGGGDPAGVVDSELPVKVPPRFEEPLRQLHDAVNGAAK
jgi:serine/threonine protein kinase